MMGLLKSRTVSVSINCDPRTVYEFVSNLENLPKWAKMFCRSVERSNGEWIVETLQGPAKVSLAERNDFGILDHYVSPSPDVEIFVPMRVVPNGNGSEVIFTVFQPADMSEEKYADDIRLVEHDLKNLEKYNGGELKSADFKQFDDFLSKAYFLHKTNQVLFLITSKVTRAPAVIATAIGGIIVIGLSKGLPDKISTTISPENALGSASAPSLP